MITTASRRKLIVVMLLGVAVAGAIVRQLTAAGSTAHDVGTLLMLLWLPVIGAVVAWVVGKLRRPAPAPAPSPFAARAAFTAHLQVELTLRAPQLPSHGNAIPEGEYECALVLGGEGFSARWIVPPGRVLPRGEPLPLDVEFLAPALALPRFAPGTAFRVLIGESFVGDGRVAALSVPAAAAPPAA